MNHKECADIAQLAEQLFCKQQVIGSSPIVGSGDSLASNFIQARLSSLITEYGRVPEWTMGADCKVN